jgi:hypothetical protein
MLGNGIPFWANRVTVLEPDTHNPTDYNRAGCSQEETLQAGVTGASG